MQVHRIAALGALALLASASSVSASIVTSVAGPVAGAGFVSGSVSGPNINITESINAFDPYSGFAPLLTIATPPSSATTYSVTKTITNNSSSTWTDYLVGVGCDASPVAPPRGTVDCYGTGLFARIVGSAPTSSQGAANQINPAYFIVNGIAIAPGQTLTLNFNLQTCANCSGAHVIFQYANTGVPEPSTFALMGGVGLLALPVWRRRQRKA